MNEYTQSIKSIAIFMIVLLFFSLIPLVIVALFSHPSADDFILGYTTSQAWQEEGTIAAVLKAAIQNSRDFYTNWQGTYSGIFFVSLQPAIFGENYYPIAPILLITLFVTGNLFLFKVILIDILSANRWQYLILTSIILLLSLQFIYDPVEGFYWYNGGMLYTGFYSLALFLIGCVLRIHYSTQLYKKIVLSLLSAILCFIIAGGNYPTALLTAIMLFLLTIYSFIKKDRNVLLLSILTLICLIGLLISVTAPGNVIRQNSVGHSPNALNAILLSFVYGGYSIANSFTVPVLLGFCFLTPFLFNLAKNSTFQFQYPLIVFILSFCIYSAQATPPFYAIGVSLPERLINIIYYSFYLLITGNLYYFLGWFARKMEQPSYAVWNNTITLISDTIKNHKRTTCALMGFLFICACIGQCNAVKGYDGNLEITNLPTSVEAIISLASGEAKIFDTEVRQRLELYLDKTVEHVVVPEHSAKPYLLYYGDITEDSNDWRNKAVTHYYNKKSIRLSDQ